MGVPFELNRRVPPAGERGSREDIMRSLMDSVTGGVETRDGPMMEYTPPSVPAVAAEIFVGRCVAGAVRDGKSARELAAEAFEQAQEFVGYARVMEQSGAFVEETEADPED